MSGGLLVNALLRETGHEITDSDAQQLMKWHAEAYTRLVGQVRPLPGAVELLAHFSGEKVKYAIATSGMLAGARPSLEMLKVGKNVPVIPRDQVRHAKPDPDLFLAAADGVGASIPDSIRGGGRLLDLLAGAAGGGLGVGLASG